jgi:hypothetical protein
MQWRKNWYSLYLKAADGLLEDFLKANSYLKSLSTEKPYTDLKSAYARLYSWTYISNLFQEIYVGTYLWKDTLDNPKLKALYKTVFTYTMVYVQLHVSHIDVLILTAIAICTCHCLMLPVTPERTCSQ